MAKSIVIVESPGKVKSISKYLGPDYEVLASLGHIMDLPKRDLGVDIENHFEPTYVVIPGKEKVLAQLKKEAKKAKAIYLAADPDREGEAICFHLAHELNGDAADKKLMHRVAFNEITKKGVQEGFAHPGEIDQNLVDAYQARRALDRIVGYQISPLLWDRVRRGISAGRVQTPALRLVVEREALIKAFVKREYWTLDAHLSAGKAPYFDARLVRRYGPDGALPKEELEVENGEQAGALRAALESASYLVKAVETKERRRNPLPPFITSKLQQDAGRKLRFSVKRTMMIAQRLYEGVELGPEGQVGLITYMRTDSTRVSEDALVEARRFIGEQFGAPYLPAQPNRFASKKGAQDAHEAIRPTSALRDPESLKKYLNEDEIKVYRLIWQRFVASQMPPAVFDQTAIDIQAAAAGDAGRYQLRTTGSVLKFDGFLKVYEESKDKEDEEDEALKHKLPALTPGQALKLLSVKSEQHFTEPPPRYTEAALVKELEEKGIGRPSTYATILSTIQDRGYVTKVGGKFHPTELGTVVNELLTKNFKDIFELQYTARMEEKLDEIEEGREKWTDTLADFYKRFSANLVYAEKHMQDYKRMETPTEHVCEKCGKPMVIRWGKHGSFLACSGYPDCTNTREVALDLPDLDSADTSQEKEEFCENCGRPMVLKRGRFGQFWACTGYPDCKTTRRLDAQQKQPERKLEAACPQCGKNLVVKHGRFGEFTACSGYPECKYIKQNLVEGFKCPKCKIGDVAEKRSKRGKTFYSCTRYPDCDFSLWQRPVPEVCPNCRHPYLVKKFLKAGPKIVCPNEGCGYEREAELEEQPAGAVRGDDRIASE